MPTEENKAVVRKFIQEIFNERKIDDAADFVTSDLVYHGLEEIKGIENFKRWIGKFGITNAYFISYISYKIIDSWTPRMQKF